LGRAIPIELAWDALRDLFDVLHDTGNETTNEKWLDRLASTVPSDVFTAQGYFKIRGGKGRTAPDARTKTVMERVRTGSLAEAALALPYFESLPNQQPDRGAILNRLEAAFEEARGSTNRLEPAFRVAAGLPADPDPQTPERYGTLYAGFRSLFAAALPLFENEASAQETTRMYELFLKVTRDPWGTVDGEPPVEYIRGRTQRQPLNTSLLRMVTNDPGPRRMARIPHLTETRESIPWRQGGWHTLRYFRRDYEVTQALSGVKGDGADEILLQMAWQPDQFKVIREFRDLTPVWNALTTRRPSELKEILMSLLRDPSLASPASCGR
jgi:hypothetical protein